MAEEDKGKALAPQDPIYQLLAANKTAITRVIPTHVTPERLMRIAHNAITGGYRLKECTPASLVNGVIEISILGLEVGRTAYLVPFKNKHSGRYEAQVIIDYRGFIELAFRSGRVDSFPFKPVYQVDEFMVSEGTHREIRHSVNMITMDRGPIVAAYAICNFKGGGYDFEVVGPADIAAVKSRSMGAKKPDSPWNTEDEWTMWCKTSVRRLSKRIPQTSELQRAVQIDELNEAGIRQKLEHIQDLIDVTPASTKDPKELYKATKGKKPTMADQFPDPGQPPSQEKVEELSPCSGCGEMLRKADVELHDCPGTVDDSESDGKHPFFPEKIKNMRKSKLNPDTEGYKGWLVAHSDRWDATPQNWKQNCIQKWNKLGYNEPFPFPMTPPEPDNKGREMSMEAGEKSQTQGYMNAIGNQNEPPVVGPNGEPLGGNNTPQNSILNGYPSEMSMEATGETVMKLSAMCQTARNLYPEICILVMEETGISPDEILNIRHPAERYASAWEFLSRFEIKALEKGIDPFAIIKDQPQGNGSFKF